jgi:hypothetical protein
MNGYEIYCTYLAFKLHFDGDYDMFKYGGHAPKHLANPDKFEMRKDKYMFHKLARKLESADVSGFLLSNFLIKRKTWTGDLVKPEAFDNYRKWCKTRDSLHYIFETDLRTIINHCSLTDAIKPKADGEFPTLLTLLLQKEITIETVLIIHQMTHCLNVWDGVYDDYIYEGITITIRKYIPFLTLDMNALKEIAKRVLTEQ